MAVTVEQLERLVDGARSHLEAAEAALIAAQAAGDQLEAGLAPAPAPAGLPAPRPRTIASELGELVFWGSECLCGNATYGTMRCDTCGEATGTTALWMEPRP